MPYDVLEKIKEIPVEYAEEFSVYVDDFLLKIGIINKSTKKEVKNKSKLEALKAVSGILSDSEAEEMKKSCGLKFKEIL